LRSAICLHNIQPPTQILNQCFQFGRRAKVIAPQYHFWQWVLRTVWCVTVPFFCRPHNLQKVTLLESRSQYVAKKCITRHKPWRGHSNT
jgi:hypothetical protein